MQITSTVTQKGQITIPKNLRDKYFLKEYSTVSIKDLDGALFIESLSDIVDLAGKIIPKKGKNVLLAREKFEKTYKRF